MQCSDGAGVTDALRTGLVVERQTRPQGLFSTAPIKKV